MYRICELLFKIKGLKGKEREEKKRQYWVGWGDDLFKKRARIGQFTTYHYVSQHQI